MWHWNMIHRLSLIHILPVVLMVCLFLGMREELEQRDEKIKSEVLLHIIIWYAVVTVLAIQEYEGWILGFVIVAAYIGILVELKNIAEKLEEAGYVLEEHPVRISDSRCAAGAAILTAAGLFVGYTCFGADVYKRQGKQYAAEHFTSG